MKRQTIQALLFICAGSLHASTVLLTDNYSDANTDAGTFNDNLTSTQGGTLATITYSVVGTNYIAQHGNGNTLLVATDTSGLGSGSVSLNNNFATQANNANQALQITFNIANVAGYTDDTSRWVQFNVGNSQNLDVGNSTVGTGVLFRVNGGAQLLSGGSSLTNGSWSANNLVTITLTDTAGTGSAFNGNGSKATISIGANNYGTFTLAQQTNAYLTFSAYNYATDQFGIGQFDNLNVTLVPEPDAALLGGLGMFALLRRRRSH